MNKLIYVLLLIFSLSYSFIFSQQAGKIVWDKTYGEEDYDEIMGVTVNPNGGFIAAGYTQSYGLGRWGNAFWVKVNSDGDSVWTHHMGGDGVDVFADLITTPDSMFVACGLTDTENNFENIYLVKINDESVVQWEKNFGGPEKDVAQSLINSSDGNIIVTGVTRSFGAGEEDLFIMKTSIDGDSLWFKTYGTPGNDGGYGIEETSDGGYVIAGIYNWSDIWLVKTDSDGDTLWTKVLGGSDFEEGLSVKQTSDGGYIIAGSTASFGAGQLDAFLIKTDSTGNVEWQKTYGGPGYDEGRRVLINNQNEYVLMANTDSNVPGEFNYFIVWTDLSGDTIRTKTYGDSGEDRCYDIISVNDEHLLIAGSNFNVASDGDASLLLIQSGNKPSGIETDPVSFAEEFFLYDAYPNPFNPQTVIRYKVNVSGMVSIKIYDILGKEVVTLINDNISAGTHEVIFDASKLSSCVYYYTLKADKFSQTKKMILMK